MKNDPLRVKSFQLALEAIKLYKYLVDERNEFVMSKQILRSATSIGANMEEGLVAYTKKEFFFKYNLSFKNLKKQSFG